MSRFKLSLEESSGVDDDVDKAQLIKAANIVENKTFKVANVDTRIMHLFKSTTKYSGSRNDSQIREPPQQELASSVPDKIDPLFSHLNG